MVCLIGLIGMNEESAIWCDSAGVRNAGWHMRPRRPGALDRAAVHLPDDEQECMEMDAERWDGMS